MSQPLHFASPEWIARIKELLAELVARHSESLADADFTLSETFTDVPPDAMTTHWSARIRSGTVEFLDHPEEADFLLVADFEAALPGARLAYADAGKAGLERADQHRDAMIAGGRMTRKGSFNGVDQSVMRVLRELHDTIARETT